MSIFKYYSYEEIMQEKENNWNNLFDDLPDDIKDYIYCNFLDYKSLVFLNKDNYKKYHKYLINYINPEHYLYYIKDIVENNLTFVFEQILDEMFLKWIKIKNIRLNNKTYNNMLKLIIEEFASCNDDNKILNMIENKYKFYNMKY